jgi:hypothetical protein
VIKKQGVIMGYLRGSDRCLKKPEELMKGKFQHINKIKSFDLEKY